MTREHFGSRRIVIMAMAGSAIGLGNIWRFPYITGEYGGAAFVLVYILCSLFISLPILLSESVIGRRTNRNTFGAMNLLAPGTRWKWLGLLTVLSPILILSYYSVVGGWSVGYFFKALAFRFSPDQAGTVSGMFGTFVSSAWQPLACHLVFLSLCAVIVFAGVKSGIERFSKITMPVLFVLILLITAYSLTLPGAGAGIRYLAHPDFTKLSGEAILAALGQSFFSLSLGVGTILTYASYVNKKEDLLAMGAGTAVADLLFAVLAGFAIIPAVFAAGIEPGSGPGLVFETLPYIFAKMGVRSVPVSGSVAILFFLTILVAALTSAISMMEVGVAYLIEEKGLSRKAATAGVFCFALAAGAACSLDSKIFGGFDALCSHVLLPLGALLFSLFVGWKMDKASVRKELTNRRTLPVSETLFPFLYALIKYAAPTAILAIFLNGILG